MDSSELLRRAEAIGADHRRDPRSTVNDRFAGLVLPAARAAARGDYGIAAGLYTYRDGAELSIIASNTMFSCGDPCGHAEVNALAALRLGPGRVPHAELSVTPRPAGGEGHGATVLLTTVEPCPMCTVAILNAGITDVLWAVPDETGGAFDAAHADRLPPVFAEIRRRVSGRTVSDNPDDDAYVAAGVVAVLRAALDANRTALDEIVTNGGVLDTTRAWARVTGDGET